MRITLNNTEIFASTGGRDFDPKEDFKQALRTAGKVASANGGAA